LIKLGIQILVAKLIPSCMKKDILPSPNTSYVTLRLGILALIFFTVTYLQGQVFAPSKKIELRAINYDMNTVVAAPEGFNTNGQQALTATQATITVTYTGFTQQAEDAFQFAVDIWELQIASDITIEIEATFESLSPGVLGSAGPTILTRDFTNAPVANTFYPIALANKLAETDLITTPVMGLPTHDINASFNSDFSSWYFGTDGNTPMGQYDFVSVVLHEIGHGLGFIGSDDVDSGTGEGSFNDPPFINDRFLENGSGVDLFDNFTNPSTALGDELESDDVFWNGSSAIAANGGSPPKLYAPNPYEPGSSVSHWDESTFPAGNANSLMTPFIGSAEAIHDPGPLTSGLFEDIGWTLGTSTTLPRILSVNPFTDMVTIKNFGTGAIDISSYQFCSKFSYGALSALMIESGSLNLSGGGFSNLVRLEHG